MSSPPKERDAQDLAVTRSFSIPVRLVEYIVSEAERRQISASAVVREALAEDAARRRPVVSDADMRCL